MKSKNYISLIAFFLLTFAFSQNVNAGYAAPSGLAFKNESSTYKDVEQAKKIGNEVVDKLVAKDFEGITKNFDDTMKQGITAEQIKTLWTQVIAAVGEYKSREATQTQEKDNRYGTYTVCQMASGKVGVEVWVDASGKIAGLWIRPA